jgi:hypothetical protein
MEVPIFLHSRSRIVEASEVGEEWPFLKTKAASIRTARQKEKGIASPCFVVLSTYGYSMKYTPDTD